MEQNNREGSNIFFMYAYLLLIKDILKFSRVSFITQIKDKFEIQSIKFFYVTNTLCSHFFKRDNTLFYTSQYVTSFLKTVEKFWYVEV